MKYSANSVWENKDQYDIAVVGAGHAGCEAALACARLGFKTVMFTVSVDSIALMPCNPNIGGSSKGHLVKEIDALGGEMGKVIDKTFIQSKMLNQSKGPADPEQQGRRRRTYPRWARWAHRFRRGSHSWETHPSPRTHGSRDGRPPLPWCTRRSCNSEWRGLRRTCTGWRPWGRPPDTGHSLRIYRC